MVFTIEPGIYVPNVGGVRIEDDIYITKDGSRNFNEVPERVTICKIIKGDLIRAFLFSISNLAPSSPHTYHPI